MTAKAWLVRYKDGSTDVTTEEWKVAMWRENGQEVVEMVEAGATPAGMPVDWDDLHSRLSRAMPRGIGSPHNACCYREHCKALEARALAAEAALAEVGERAITAYASHIDVAMRDYDDNLHYGDDALGPDFFIERGMERAAAAIRAQGE